MNILIVEDDARTAGLLQELLAVGSNQVAWEPTGEAALAYMRSQPVDLVVLDVNLPGRNGFSVCREIRETSRVAILMLSARGAPEDRVDGLRMGADDYLAKPFHAQELVARVEALARRLAPSQSESGPAILEVGELTLDVHARAVHLRGHPVDLTGAEFDIFRALVERAGRVVSRDRLMALARGAEFGAFDRAIDVHISNIRKKLGDSARSPRWIRTVRGVGYQVPTGLDHR
jgi:DNA-binding response OmpR family regulator